MTIKEFEEKYSGQTKEILVVIDQWVLEKQIDDFLGTPLYWGVLISDRIKGEELVDSIPKIVKDGFRGLEKKPDTINIYEMKAKLLEEAKEGEKNIRGLISRIQGQIGENLFKESVESVGVKAEFADIKNQQGWDIKIDNGPGDPQYVQVKVYDDANAAIAKLKEIQIALAKGEITDGYEVISQVTFAVNEEIFEKVQQKASEHGIPAKILNIRASREEIVSALETAKENVVDSPLNNLFEELLGGVCTGAALHAAVNGFLVWKGAKEMEIAVEDTAYSSGITAGGMGVSFGTEAALSRIFLIGELDGALAVLTSPIGGLFIFGAGLYTRGILKRLADRRHFARRIYSGNQKLEQLALTFS